ncbi:MAG: aldehyde ferredoxin oxidoreductase, partial [Thermodesulfobacteria bacterium]|nr:aldehyde ferredoxin oxidoreductase [Thermodesulfobacteriota bacterium]
FRSPETGGLHVSELGGAGYKTIGSGVHAVAVKGRSAKPLIVFISCEKDSEPKVKFLEVERELIEEVYRGYAGLKGVYALTKYLLDEHRDFFLKYNARAVVVGKGAWTTRMGSLVSIDVNPKEGKLVEGSEDFAGRGGGGSVLVQAHNVVGIVMGGKWKPELPEELSDTRKFHQFFKKISGRDFVKAVTSSTYKYRFNPKIGAGGTFGCNYPHYREWLLTFCYNSIYLKKEFRKRITEIILEHYWKPFKEKVFDKEKPWKTCGEPCPVACKKLWKKKKVDYEPFQGIGPLIGVFNLDLASEIVDKIDSAGLDAIATGHVVIFILESVDKGLLTMEEAGISQRPELNPFVLNPQVWEVNGHLAMEIIDGLLNKKTDVLKLIAERGIRKTCEILSEKYEDRVERAGISFKDVAIYQPYGEWGYMTPNYYWTKGFIIPLFINGKYWTEYSLMFENPEEFVKHVFERIMKELGLSNSGICRFHRGWIENLLDRFYEVLGISDYEASLHKIYNKIACYGIKSGAIPQPLEGEKAIDLFVLLAEELNAHEWIPRFQKNKRRAYLEWFERFYLTYLGYIGLDVDKC